MAGGARVVYPFTPGTPRSTMSDHPTGDPAPPPQDNPAEPSGTTPPDGAPTTPYPPVAPYPPTSATVGYPAYPGYSGYPPYIGAPSMPLPPDPNAPPSMPYPPVQYPPPPSAYAGPPTQPGAAPSPGYPGYPTYPGYPPAGYPTYPGYPTIPGAPVTVPLYGQPGAFGAVPVPPKTRSRWNPLSWPKGPLPALLTAVLALVALLAVAGGAAFGVQAGKGDWASGAIAGGTVALALAALALVLMGVRFGFGRRAGSFFAVGLASIVILAALGGSGVVLLPLPLHRAQAQAFEQNHQWSAAIAQYRLAGERPPGSDNLARIYDEWGDELLSQQRYFDASQQYETVLTTYPAAAAEVQRAKEGDAHALYALGAQMLAQKQYQQAILQFAIVTSTYPATTYATQAHAGTATAYYALGQQALQGADCSTALTDYKTLVAKYSDTPEGGKAKTALAAPVAVSGQITNLPGPVSYVALSSRLTGGIATQPVNYDPTNLSQDYKTRTTASGHFTFPSVAQGKYNVAVFLADGAVEFWYNTPPYDPYTVIVAPLCPVDAGIYTY